MQASPSLKERLAKLKGPAVQSQPASQAAKLTDVAVAAPLLAAKGPPKPHPAIKRERAPAADYEDFKDDASELATLPMPVAAVLCDLPDVPTTLDVWSFDDTPPGSAYSQEEWAAAEAENPGCLVMEIMQGRERALITFERAKLDHVRIKLFERSLMVNNKIIEKFAYRHCEFAKNAHKSEEFGLKEFAIFVTRNTESKHSWLKGSILRNWNEPAPSKLIAPAKPSPLEKFMRPRQK